MFGTSYDVFLYAASTMLFTFSLWFLVKATFRIFSSILQSFIITLFCLIIIFFFMVIVFGPDLTENVISISVSSFLKLILPSLQSLVLWFKSTLSFASPLPIDYFRVLKPFLRYGY